VITINFNTICNVHRRQYTPGLEVQCIGNRKHTCLNRSPVNIIISMHAVSCHVHVGGVQDGRPERKMSNRYICSCCTCVRVAPRRVNAMAEIQVYFYLNMLLVG